jgi:hypothetical protein
LEQPGDGEDGNGWIFFSFFILSWDLKDGVVAVILESARVVRYGLLCLGLFMVSWVGLMC